MSISAQDRATLRSLAERYTELANLDVQKERIERYYKTNALEEVRPVVLIHEIPWGEIRSDALANTCSKELRWLETELRQTLYRWQHFQVDMVIPPAFGVAKRRRSTGIGLDVDEVRIQGDTGAYIAAHEYKDILKTDEDLEKLEFPTITYDKEATERAAEQAQEVFDGLMPVELRGVGLHYNMWDRISTYRGVDSLLLDLAMRPEFMHRVAQRFTDIAESMFRQLEEQDMLDPYQMLVHCTVAYARDLPADDFSGKARAKDVWGRCAAQIFGSVSPRMHDEFDLVYNEKLFRDCGLVYYGCCEPMDNKVDILRKRFKNLRKISITPWADSRRAAENIGKDFVLAAKPNPAFVSSETFNPKPVEDEMIAYIEPCLEHGTTCEFVLKDISTIANRSENLTQWADTVMAVVDRYYG